jgi:glucan phosphoethanolaminetransferase (alkaline phosphatase superfamily)
MPTCVYPVYTHLWFWLIALGVLFLAIGLIVWDVQSRLNQTWWVWLLIIGGAILLLIGIFLAFWTWWSNQPTPEMVMIQHSPQECAPPIQQMSATRRQQETVIYAAPPSLAREESYLEQEIIRPDIPILGNESQSYEVGLQV